MRSFVLSLSLAFVLAGSAAAYEPVRPSEVVGLAGTQVFVEVACEVRWKEPFRNRKLLVGEPVTLKGRGERQIDAWCIVADEKGEEWEVMVQHLSKVAPAYSMAATGTIEEFVPKIAKAAIDIPGQLADLWKANAYNLDENDEARQLRTAYEAAFDAHKALLAKLVGGRISKTSVLSNEEYKWLWTADPSVLECYCEGIKYVERYKKSDFLKKAEGLRDFVNSADGLRSTAGEMSRIKSELARKPWQSSVKKDVPEAARAALDQEETSKREKRLSELEKRLGETRERIAKDRAAHGL